MPAIIVSILLILMASYLLLGLLVTVFFLSNVLHKIDESAHGAGIGFRIIIMPGCMVFWPVLLRKWFHIRKETDESSRGDRKMLN